MKEKIIQIFQNGIQDNLDREIMAHSLFYYCCGKDPTPIVSLGEFFSLYVYADIVGYGHGNFVTETRELYNRLEAFEFRKMDTCFINFKRKYCVKQAELSVWSTKKGDLFHLLYVQGNAVDVFMAMYGDVKGNYILPKCICNQRYELMPVENGILSQSILFQVEKRAEYVMGYCGSEKYKEYKEFDYLGDYFDTKVTLFRCKDLKRQKDRRKLNYD